MRKALFILSFCFPFGISPQVHQDFGSPNSAGLNSPKTYLIRYENCPEITKEILSCVKGLKTVQYTLDLADKVVKLELELDKPLLLSYGIKENGIDKDILESYVNTYYMIHGRPTIYSKINKIALYKNLAENYAIIYTLNGKLVFKAYRSKDTYLKENKELIVKAISGAPVCDPPSDFNNKAHSCGQWHFESFK
ncbi:hypothetical protein [Leptospira haakeii]|uniref:Uncharacterized protein n=1 Tax=Leptospira haakeii TaxID=2023198 RepID=A0ABX4PN20_9LEPT|nr:hypothetical protein [Leptospira haakeii]PKA16418.1 hypothetical protein CH363_09905 [Leptospira haakeii]PKA18101.1 hypothetical protein CH377_19420 [Leptospira haakeii]